MGGGISASSVINVLIAAEKLSLHIPLLLLWTCSQDLKITIAEMG